MDLRDPGVVKVVLLSDADQVKVAIPAARQGGGQNHALNDDAKYLE